MKMDVNQCSSHWRIHVAILGISNPSRKTRRQVSLFRLRMHRDCRKFTSALLLRRIREPPMYCLFAREQLRMKIHKSALAALILTLYCGAVAGHSFAAGSPAASSTVNAALSASGVAQGPGDLGALIR